MTITATINLVAIDMPCYVTERTDAALMLSEFGTIDELRDAIRDEFNGSPQIFEDDSGHQWDWSDAHWTALESALQSDIGQSELAEIREAIDEIVSANGGTSYYDLVEEFDDQTYVYFTVEFEDDGIPEDTDRFTFRTVDALAAFACALFNGERSGLEESDMSHIDRIEREYGSPVGFKDLGFRHGGCEITGLGGEIYRYQFMYPKGEPNGEIIRQSTDGQGIVRTEFEDGRVEWTSPRPLSGDEFDAAIDSADSRYVSSEQASSFLKRTYGIC